MTSYKDLIVWQKSILLVKKTYLLTNKFPQSELYGITNQMRRAAISIPSNIAEGYSRKSRKEYAQFISVAYDSGTELETQILISKELNFLDQKEFNEVNGLLTEVLKMLNVLTFKLR